MQTDKEKTLANLETLLAHMRKNEITPNMWRYFEDHASEDAYSLVNNEVVDHACGTAACLLGEATRCLDLKPAHFFACDDFSMGLFEQEYFPWLLESFDSRWSTIFSCKISDNFAVDNLEHHINLWKSQN